MQMNFLEKIVGNFWSRENFTRGLARQRNGSKKNHLETHKKSVRVKRDKEI